MFLKRIEMQGFKSFADRVEINFDHSITGIVGPNGCGKSNITDAIKWVLGEQSAKNLRGSSMEDVIFNGSQDRNRVNMAEVTLIFDNANKVLNSDKDEIEVTRRIYRDKEAEYYINRNRVRLKDINDLILDTGLGKDSLGMISQGNITNFAESKTVDRRSIFEEAAGVAKYKKRKLESLAKLERTKDNIDKAQSIIDELEKQVNPLKRQAKKAEIYREKKARLEEIEINVIIKDIDELKKQIDDANSYLFKLETENTIQQTSINVNEVSIDEAKKEISQLDNKINSLQDKLMDTINQIQILEKHKVEIDEKRKYSIEVGNKEEKIKELNIMLEEAKLEYLDREKRVEEFRATINNLSTNLYNLALDLSLEKQNYETNLGILRKYQNRKNILENQLKEPYSSQGGVKSIMDNKTSLFGIMGVVGEILKPMEGYEEAISTALQGAIYNIVTKNEKSARSAIEFLKKNLSGRATFLPINVLKPRYLRREDEIVCENQNGFLGYASDFVEYDDEFEIVSLSLLNNIIVIDNLENGNELSRLLNYSYNIVTLDGDIIHRGGSMTGGKNKYNNSLLTAKKELNEVNNSIVSYEAKIKLNEKKLKENENSKQDVESKLYDNRISLAKLEPILDAKRSKYEKLKSDLEELGSSEINNMKFDDDIIVKLNNIYKQRDDYSVELKSNRENKFKLQSNTERKEAQLRQLRQAFNNSNIEINNIKIDIATNKTKLESNLNRLASEYKLTYEYAKNNMKTDIEISKDEVIRLREEISNLGNINMNAPEEFVEVNSRYEFLLSQIKELIDSKNKLLSAIDEMDETMIKNFKEMFDKINTEFDITFKKMFGGGKAKLILEDKEDILNTGIDIDVQPPGKSIQNIKLLSGGEKSLIAICVLFSILKVKGIPLVVFDEVEAALDQINVEKFATYIKQFTDNTQFIVVTHRIGTMEKADILFGVTMQKQGISQMMKVELYEAINNDKEVFN